MSDLGLRILSAVLMVVIPLLAAWFGYRKGFRNRWERELRRQGFGDGWEREMKKRLQEMREWGM